MMCLHLFRVAHGDFFFFFYNALAALQLKFAGANCENLIG